uniref:Uncharacterized protein n=1 Tax=Rhizophora mucronata TaxID=61149 RepID=A0A2P2MMP4_RHIMU
MHLYLTKTKQYYYITSCFLPFNKIIKNISDYRI